MVSRLCNIFSKTLTVVFLSICLIVGCTTKGGYNSDRICLDKTGVYKRCGELSPPSINRAALKSEQHESIENTLPSKSVRKPKLNYKKIGDYTEQLAMGLYERLERKRFKGRVAIATFVDFDENLRHGSVLGNQISEFFFNELSSLGVTVIDIKALGVIDIRSTGDFVFSRADRNVINSKQVTHVLTGTLIRNDRGMIVNARIIELTTQKVEATAKTLIPNFVLN